MVSRLEQYLSGTVQTTTKAPVTTPAATVGGMATMQGALQTMGQQAAGGNWQAAQGSLRQVEMAWGTTEPQLAKAGVSDTDLNGFTADLADMALSVATQNNTALQQDIQNAQKALRWMSTETTSGMAPTLSQLTTLVNDLNQSIVQGNWSQATKDAQALKTITDSMEKGF